MSVPSPERPKIRVYRGQVQYHSPWQRLGRVPLYIAYLSLIVIIAGVLLYVSSLAMANGQYDPPMCTPGYGRSCTVPNGDGTYDIQWYDVNGLRRAAYRPCAFR